MDLPYQGILAVFFTTNLIAFGLMWWDKIRSRQKGVERISEGMLFFLAVMFGSLGIFLGMFVFRHKTRTWYFLIGIPMVLAQNIVFLHVLQHWIEQAF